MPSNVITFGEALAWVHERIQAYWNGELDGHCVHGVYVGGCGPDWMCGRCESDYQPSPTEWAMEIVREERRFAAANELRQMHERLLVMVGEEKLFSEKERTEMWKAWVGLKNVVR